MKKTFLVLFALVAFSCTAFASNWTSDMKKAFYDGFVGSVFESLEQSLVAQGFEKTSVKIFISKSKARFNRTQLENKTWGCVKKHTPEEVSRDPNPVLEECFADFGADFINNNTDLARTYLKR